MWCIVIFGSLFTTCSACWVQDKSPISISIGAATFDGGEAFTMMTASFVFVVEVWRLLLYL